MLSSSLQYTTLHNREQLEQGITNSETVNTCSVNSINNVHNVPAPDPTTMLQIASLLVPRLSAGIGMNGRRASNFRHVVEPPRYDEEF